MKISSTNYSINLAIIGAYPALSILFTVFGLRNMLDLWATIVTSVGVYTFGLLLRTKLIEYHPSFVSSVTPLFSFLTVSLAAPFLAIWKVKEVELFFGLTFFVNMFGSIPILWLLRKRGIITKLDRGEKEVLIGVWFVFILSAAILTSVCLAEFKHFIDLFVVISFGIVFGWFSPETLPGKIKPTILYVFYVFIIGSIYIVLETVNPSLSYPTLNFGGVWLISYIAGYAMLASRCLLETEKTHLKLIERTSNALWVANVIRLAEASKRSFIVNKIGWTKSIRYSLLFIKGRILFLRLLGPSDTEGTIAVTGAVVGGAVGAAIGNVLEKTLRESLIELEVDKPESLNEVSVDELIKMDKENFEIYYEDISKIEMKEPTTKLEKSFSSGMLFIEEKKTYKFNIAPNQRFEECVEIVRSIIAEKPMKINVYSMKKP